MAHKGGGSWKVAYADFVTAMMALFLVLWITAQDAKVKEAVERAFRNPFSSVTKDSVGILPSKETQAVKSQTGNFDSASAVELTMLRRLNQDLMKTLQSNPEDQENNVRLDLTPEGLRINVFDSGHKAIFEPDSEQFTDYGKWIFSTLAWEISRYASFNIELEGHTERGRPPVRENYGNWELSSGRANAARRALLEHGVRGGQIRKVAGFADTMPMAEAEPEDAANRRVTVMLRIRANGDSPPP
jgi:chemotaxis protein MotB